MRIKYASKKFQPASLRLIEQATDICASYASNGLSLTLRQLYYQFVARGLLPNEQRAYNRLGATIADARMAGLFDWDYIIDRTHNGQRGQRTGERNRDHRTRSQDRQAARQGGRNHQSARG